MLSPFLSFLRCRLLTAAATALLPRMEGRHSPSVSSLSSLARIYAYSNFGVVLSLSPILRAWTGPPRFIFHCSFSLLNLPRPTRSVFLTPATSLCRSLPRMFGPCRSHIRANSYVLALTRAAPSALSPPYLARRNRRSFQSMLSRHAG